MNIPQFIAAYVPDRKDEAANDLEIMLSEREVEACNDILQLANVKQNTPPRREALDQRDDPTEKGAASRGIFEVRS